VQVFLFSNEGLGVLSTDQEVVMFTILDIVAKAGFTFQYLYLQRQGAKPHPEAWPPSAIQVTIPPRKVWGLGFRVQGSGFRV